MAGGNATGTGGVSPPIYTQTGAGVKNSVREGSVLGLVVFAVGLFVL